MPSDGFLPFADEASVRTLHGLTIENGRARIALYGNLELTRDRRGLEAARALKEIVDALVARLESEPDLPGETPVVVERPSIVRNPFA